LRGGGERRKEEGWGQWERFSPREQGGRRPRRKGRDPKICFKVGSLRIAQGSLSRRRYGRTNQGTHHPREPQKWVSEGDKKPIKYFTPEGPSSLILYSKRRASK
jgi:hypothetical protein